MSGLKDLTYADMKEIKELKEIANNLAGRNLFGLFVVLPSQHVGQSYHWCLERINQIRGLQEPIAPTIRWVK